MIIREPSISNRCVNFLQAPSPRDQFSAAVDTSHFGTCSIVDLDMRPTPTIVVALLQQSFARVVDRCPVREAHRNERADVPSRCPPADRSGYSDVRISAALMRFRTRASTAPRTGLAFEGTGRNLVMAPGLTEVAGPRVHVSPVENLPLMWVDQPQFTGLRRLVKRAVDLVGAGEILLLVMPFLIFVALLVKATSRGSVLYRSVRLGQQGRPFTVYKFRSMHSDAEQARAELSDLNEGDAGMLFKIHRDPRVTPVGRFIRKFSLDELPQLFNVICGSMSLVGPRPPLPDEVERYRAHVRRRLLVKPGLTGLWQVSGRSDLSWDESVRLDLYYVENWSLALDLAIIARTVRAVLRSHGAY